MFFVYIQCILKTKMKVRVSLEGFIMIHAIFQCIAFNTFLKLSNIFFISYGG